MNNFERPLMGLIKNKVLELGGTVSGVTVSIQPTVERYQTKEGEEYWVKWFYWQVHDKHCAILYESDLLVAHGELSEAAIRSDLKNTFNNLETSVNNDIYFED